MVLPINLLYLCLSELQGYYLQARPPPCFQVLLYFEQCHDNHTHKRPITVQVHTTIPFPGHGRDVCRVASKTCMLHSLMWESLDFEEQLLLTIFTYRWSHYLLASCSSWVSRAAHTTWGLLITHLCCGSRCPLLSRTTTQGAPNSMTPCKTKSHVTHKCGGEIQHFACFIALGG